MITSIYFHNYMYSQICIQWSPWGQRKNDSIRQLTTYLTSVDPDFQFRSEMICILLLLEGIFNWKTWWSLCYVGVFL
jgi:hypothetical protein